MNSSGTPPSSGPTARDRPSLADAPPENLETVRILSSLKLDGRFHDTPPVSKSRVRWSWVGLGVTVLAAALAIGWWSGSQSRLGTPSITADLSAPAPSPAEPSAAETVANSSASLKPAPMADTAQAPARIETVEPPPALAGPARIAPAASDASPSAASGGDSAPASIEKARREADAEVYEALITRLAQPPQSRSPASPHASKPATLDHAAITRRMHHCDTLARDAARQCRRQACDGAWGKTSACPVRAAAR